MGVKLTYHVPHHSCKYPAKGFPESDTAGYPGQLEQSKHSEIGVRLHQSLEQIQVETARKHLAGKVLYKVVVCGSGILGRLLWQFCDCAHRTFILPMLRLVAAPV